jgi:hypothetical protein
VLRSRGFLIDEAGQPAQMAPVGAGDIAAIRMNQLSTDLAGYGRLQGRSADVNPSLEMTGTGLQYQGWCLWALMASMIRGSARSRSTRM